MIVTHTHYVWFVTAMVTYMALQTIVRDVIALYRYASGRTGRTPQDKDLVFGAYIGIIIGLVGLAGVVKYHWF